MDILKVYKSYKIADRCYTKRLYNRKCIVETHHKYSTPWIDIPKAEANDDFEQDAVMKLTNLRTLYISYYSQITNDGLKELTQLIELSIYNNQTITSDAVQHSW